MLAFAFMAMNVHGCAAISGTDGDYRSDAVEGWEGPLAMFSSPDEPPPCPDDFVDERTYRRGVLPTNGSCGCDVPLAACNTRLTVHDAADATCANANSSMDLIADSCVEIDAAGTRLKATLTTEAACVATEALAPPAFEESMRVCRCKGDCLSPPPNALTCVRQVGDVPCPANTNYVDRHVLFESVDDTRRCDCGSASCVGKLRWHKTVPPYTPLECCQIGVLGDPPFALDDCSEVVDDVDELVVVKFVPSGSSCENMGDDALSGDVRLTTPVTVCCLP